MNPAAVQPFWPKPVRAKRQQYQRPGPNARTAAVRIEVRDGGVKLRDA
jgi:hypothetical protein